MIFKSLREFQKRKDTHVDGSALVHDPERTANHQDEDDDFRLLHEAVEKRRKHLPRLGFRVEILLVFNRQLVFIIKRAVDVFAGTDKPRHDGSNDDYEKNDYECMRYLTLRHKIFFCKDSKKTLDFRP